MDKYIDAEKLRALLETRYNTLKIGQHSPFRNGKTESLRETIELINSLQQEQPMPNSTQLIELWHADKEMLKEKDFRDDPWRLAYNAFMCGFGRGIAVNKQEQPEVDLDAEIAIISEGIINQTSGEDTIIELNEHIGYLEDCEEVIVNIRKKQ